MFESCLILLISLLCWGIVRKSYNWNWKTNPFDATKLKTVSYGYKGIPGIGFLPNFKWETCRKKLIKIREQHGKICKVRMGSFECIWINDYHLIKSAWSKNTFCGRPDLVGISVRTKNSRGGIIFNDGKDFLEQRRFVMCTLKTFGLFKGNTVLEQFILEEIQDLVSTLVIHTGDSVSTRHIFNISAFNIIWKLITGGSRFQHDDPVMSKLVDVLNRNMELDDGACAAFFMPWLSRFCSRLVGWNQYVADAHYIFEFWVGFAKTAMKNHKKPQQPTSTYNNSTFISEYCNKIERCTDPTSSFYGVKGVISLATVLQDLFIAGSETTATTLQWICLYQAAFPECQQKAFQQIRSFLEETPGYTPTVQINDRIRLPYIEAFIKESLRFSTLAPLGMLHCTTDDVELHGYFIPKGTLLQMNVAAVHFDETHWENPEEFRPERFLTDNEDSLKYKSKEIAGFLPFSSGKRMCPGAELAEETLFLALVSILQKFEIRMECNAGLNLEPKIGVSAVPFPHKLLFIERRVSCT